MTVINSSGTMVVKWNVRLLYDDGVTKSRGSHSGCERTS